MKQVALITGASRGIGKSIAQTFAKEGYLVVLHYHTNKSATVKTAEELRSKGYEASTVQADISVRHQVEDMVSGILSRFGHIDVLVNNAGVSASQLFTDITEAQWRHMMGVNLDGVFYCCQCVLPGMISRKQGSIINISSIWGLTGASCEVHYSAAKAAVIGLTRALAKELGPSGIRVNCIAPGLIDTDMNHDLDENTVKNLIEETPLGRIGTPLDIARTALFLAGDDASFITGQVISPNGGFLI
jgi:3-oxoacyl-[acyl-carrier protein] reductase